MDSKAKKVFMDCMPILFIADPVAEQEISEAHRLPAPTAGKVAAKV
jgi:hypothetical protein